MCPSDCHSRRPRPHRLVVEIDGGGHSPRHDAGRDRVLHASGYSVLRLAV